MREQIYARAFETGALHVLEALAAHEVEENVKASYTVRPRSFEPRDRNERRCSFSATSAAGALAAQRR